jgi:photosystem II stability/assembly factor-like uncharacterized protein
MHKTPFMIEELINRLAKHQLERAMIIFLAALLGNSVWAQKLNFDHLKNLSIRNVGPANMSGRITAIDVVTSNPKIIYVGAASGGVWKSENGGSAWRPIFDEQPTQNIGAVTIQQSNPSVIWIGTGEGNPRNSMNLGMGIFKSTDAGATWAHMGLEKTKTIHRILVHPENPNIVFAGAMGDPFTPDENRGLYKTEDGGNTWKRILYTNNQSGVGDMVMHPTSPNIIFVALYEHRRTPFYFTSGGSGSGLYVTHDAGQTWKKISSEAGLPQGDLGRIGIAIAPSNPNRIYAKIEATKNKLYRSDDGGKSWYMINENQRFTNNRPFYFQDLAVDPKDPDRLYNIYQPLSVSYDGGVTFDAKPMIPADETKGIHADFHAFWVNPKDAEHFIIGGDGGLGITYDHGKSWYFPETIPVAQFYTVSVDNDMPYNVYGGMQDNGNWSGPGYTWKRGGIRTLYWQYLVGGDGFDISPDLDNSRFGYGSSQNGNLYRYDKLTGYYVSVQPPSNDNTKLRFNWNAGFARSPFNASKVYYGSQFVHVSYDKGSSWEIISPDLTTNNPEHQKGDYGGLTLDISGAEMYNSILTIAPSPLDAKTIWVGTDDGQVQLTTDGGETWKNLSEKITGLPHEAWIAQIKASSHKAGSAWLVANNYRKGDYAPYLFKTEDYGDTWELMAGQDEVKGYTLCMVQDSEEPNLVFLGTENGLWVSMDGGNQWEQFKNGFPSVSTMDMVIQEPESALIIGTFGRAIWVLDDLLSLREVARGNLNNTLTAFPVNKAVQVKGLFINPPGNIWTGFHTTFEGENKAFKKTKIPYYFNELPDSTVVINAAIYDDNKRLVNTIKGTPNEKGLNYLIWKLDEQSNKLPGSWEDEFSRGIPVLPGKYSVVMNFKEQTDTTAVEVIADPRFNIASEVDRELFNYRMRLNEAVGTLSNQLISLDKRKKAIAKLQKEKGLNSRNIKRLSEMYTQLELLEAKGRTPRPKRQVGAWKSDEVTPYSSVRDALKLSAARTEPLSQQHWRLLEIAEEMVSGYITESSRFNSILWEPFVKRLKRHGIQLP